MPQTAAQRRASAAARMRAARGEAPVAVMEAETEGEAAYETAAEVPADLKTAFAGILQAREMAANVEQAEEAIKLLRSAVGRLPNADFRVLAANPEFQDVFQMVATASGTKPGEPVFDANGRQIGNVPYSYQDAQELFPKHTWVPMRTNGCISWNGVTISVVEGIEVTTPKIFYDIEQESIRMTREAVASQHAVLAYPGRPAPADGVSIDTGWYKRSNEELERAEGVER